MATRVAVPRTYALGESSTLSAEWLALSNKFGPWAPRQHAALHYAETFGSLSSTWDWAAASLHMHATDPPLRDPLRDGDTASHAPASKPPLRHPSADRKTGIVKLRGDAQMSLMPVSVSSGFDPKDAPQEKEAFFSEVGNVDPIK